MPPTAPLSNHAESWYVCFTKPRQEALAKRKLEEQGYQVFLPMFTRWEKRKEVWARKQQVMFPRYAFLRCGRPEQSIGPVRSTPGMSGLVTFGTTPAKLDAVTVAAIRSLTERQETRAEKDRFPFRAGDAVEICDGPLKGLSGIVSGVAKERVTVLLGLLGREKPVGIPPDHLALG